MNGLTQIQYREMMNAIHAQRDNDGEYSEDLVSIPEDLPMSHNVALTIRKTRKPNEQTSDYEGMILFIKEAYWPTKWEGHFEWDRGLHYHALLTTSSLEISKGDINRRLNEATGACRGWNFKVDFLDTDEDYEKWQGYIRKNAGCD